MSTDETMAAPFWRRPSDRADSRIPLGSELKPQRELADAVSSGVTGASGLNLSECALPYALSQIVARIIAQFGWLGRLVKLVSNFNLNLSVSWKSLASPRERLMCSRANQRPHARRCQSGQLEVTRFRPEQWSGNSA